MLEPLSNFYALHYNAIIPFITIALFGAAAGLVGTFLILRKQALISDAVTHSTLPGLGLGFLATMFFGSNLFLLLAGSAVSAALGAALVNYYTRNTKLSTDTSIASVMSFFYGGGLIIFSIIQHVNIEHRAGLNSFLLGSVSGLGLQDLIFSLVIFTLTLVAVITYFRRLRLHAFDEKFGRLIGMKSDGIEFLITFLMITVVCIGLKSIGAILVIALLIIPPITARLWINGTVSMLVLAAIISVISCMAGAFSSLWHDLPTGSSIVLCSFLFFIVSLVWHTVLNGVRHE